MSQLPHNSFASLQEINLETILQLHPHERE